MAAVQTETRGRDPVLMVDAPRLAAVANWRSEYGIATAERAAAILHPQARGVVTVDGAEVTVEATLNATPIDNFPVYVEAVLADPLGHRVVARLGPLTAQRQQFRAPVAGCAKAPNCRLVSLAMVEAKGVGTAYALQAGGSVTVQQLGQAGPDRTLLDAKGLADRTRWRTTVTVVPANLLIGSQSTGLGLTVARNSSSGSPDAGIYPMDSPVPLPAIRAPGPKPVPPTLLGDQRASVGSVTLPIDQVAQPAWLPRLGRTGALLDLEYADRAAGDLGGGDSMQVWMTGNAPDGIRRALVANGLTVLGEETVGQVTSRYEHLGPPLALRFTLGAAVVGLVLAAGSLALVAAVERRPRGQELAALRTQGASAQLTRRISNGGYVVLVVVSVVLGVLAALLIRAFIGDVVPFFADGWVKPS
jgi:hypothetical protein